MPAAEHAAGIRNPSQEQTFRLSLLGDSPRHTSYCNTDAYVRGASSAGKLRVRRAIAAPERDRGQNAKERALRYQWRRTENDHIAELPCDQCELQQIRHTLPVGMPKPREAIQGSIIGPKRSPGVTSTRTRASRSLAFHQSCHTFGSIVAVSSWRRVLVYPPRFMVSSPSSTVKRSTSAGWRCSPTTRAPTSASSSATARRSGFWWGSSRIVTRSPVIGFSQDLANLDRCSPAARADQDAT